VRGDALDAGCALLPPKRCARVTGQILKNRSDFRIQFRLGIHGLHGFTFSAARVLPRLAFSVSSA
jgi:hypothetical protein